MAAIVHEALHSRHARSKKHAIGVQQTKFATALRIQKPNESKTMSERQGAEQTAITIAANNLNTHSIKPKQHWKNGDKAVVSDFGVTNSCDLKHMLHLFHYMRQRETSKQMQEC
jgi:hypothetical protein